jgi:hypothetical protein
VNLRPLFLGIVLFTVLVSDASATARRCRRTFVEALALPNSYLGQLHPDLMRAFENSPALCGPTCMQNAVRLAKFASGASADPLKVAVEDTVDWIGAMKKIAPRVDPYDPKTDGITFELSLKGLAQHRHGLENMRFKTKTEDDLPARDLRRLETFFRQNPQFQWKGGRIRPKDLQDAEIDFSVLSFADLDGNRQLTDFVHAVLAVYDSENRVLRVLDPHFPDAVSEWEFAPAIPEYRTVLRRRRGPYTNDRTEVVVHDWIGFRIGN